MIYSVNGIEQIVRYAQVNRIRLNRPRLVNNMYVSNCVLHVTDGPNIHLQSFSKTEEEITNQFNHYNQFVRVLHLHLQSKSRAKYSYGMSYSLLFMYVSIAAIMLGFSYPLSLVLSELMMAVYIIVPGVTALCLYKILSDKPGTYNPSVIPYHILPGTSI